MLARWPSISQSTVASGVLVSEDIWAQLKPVATTEIPFWNGGTFLSQQVTTRCLSSSTMSTSPTAPTWYPSSHPQTTPDASLLWAFRWDARKHPSPWPQADQWGSGTPEATLTLCWGLNPYWQLAPRCCQSYGSSPVAGSPPYALRTKDSLSKHRLGEQYTLPLRDKFAYKYLFKRNKGSLWIIG